MRNAQRGWPFTLHRDIAAASVSGRAPTRGDGVRAALCDERGHARFLAADGIVVDPDAVLGPSVAARIGGTGMAMTRKHLTGTIKGFIRKGLCMGGGLQAERGFPLA